MQPRPARTGCPAGRWVYAVIDSGIADHPDFYTTSVSQISRVAYAENFVAGESTTYDAYGHGTHVTGILAGSGRSSTSTIPGRFSYTFHGVAPAAQLISLRVMDAQGSGTDSAVIATIDRAIALKDRYTIRVINLSLGRPVYESYTVDPLCQAVERAWRAGIVVVAAAGNFGRNNQAGNDGYGTVTSPANDPLASRSERCARSARRPAPTT